MHQEEFPSHSEDIEKAFDLVHQGFLVPSMRFMQFAGQAIQRSNARGYNCSYTALETFKDFSDLFWLLMNGCGTGYSVQKYHVDQLPTIKAGYKFTFVIPDNKEGWADSLIYLLQNPSTVFNYSKIRPKGALISSGGTASGPESLEEMIENVRRVLLKADGRKLTSFECFDIMCLVAQCVVVGGVRRAATIALFDFEDEEMFNAKSGEWWKQHPEFGRANISVILDRNHPNFQERLRYSLQKTFDSGCGEPGITLKNAPLTGGFNPCAEISLLNRQHCVSGDTPLITRDGIVDIQDAIGKEIEIWNGRKWSSVTPLQTGTNQKIVRVAFGDGSHLDCTEEHRFSVKNRFQNEFSEVMAKDLMKFGNYTIQMQPFEMEMDKGISITNPYTLGAIVGDGCVHTQKDGYKRVFIDLYGEKDFSMPVEGKRGVITSKKNVNLSSVRVNCRDSVDISLAEDLKYNNQSLRQLFSWNKESILQFLAGWIDADGSEIKTGGIRLYISNESRASIIQLLLTKAGIRSSLCLCSPKGFQTNKGERKEDLFYLQITDCSLIPCHRVDTSRGHKSKAKGKYVTVRSVEELPGLHDVYCFEEKETHQAVFGNVLTYQCNLTEINVAACNSEAEFFKAAEAAALIGTLQASYTDFDYIHPDWKKNCDDEALLGVSITAQAEGWELLSSPGVLKKAASIVRETNETWAKKIGIKPAARLTTTKPSGNTSAWLGTTSGIHAAHSDFYLRRLRVDRKDAFGIYLIARYGENEAQSGSFIESDAFDPESIVVSVPINKKGAITRNQETPIDLLNRMKFIRENWIAPGHVYGDDTHNVSLTLNYKLGEEQELTEWMIDNAEYWAGISLLPYDGGTYIQTPFEEITEQEYYEWLEKTPSEIDFSSVRFSSTHDSRLGEVACGGKDACEIR